MANITVHIKNVDSVKNSIDNRSFGIIGVAYQSIYEHYIKSCKCIDKIVALTGNSPKDIRASAEMEARQSPLSVLDVLENMLEQAQKGLNG